MFHSNSGICFERIEHRSRYELPITGHPGDAHTGLPEGTLDGGVRICRLRPNEPMRDNCGAGETLVILTASEWASVVASMSALGEFGTTHAMFLAAQKR